MFQSIRTLSGLLRKDMPAMPEKQTARQAKPGRAVVAASACQQFRTNRSRTPAIRLRAFSGTQCTENGITDTINRADARNLDIGRSRLVAGCRHVGVIAHQHFGLLMVNRQPLENGFLVVVQRAGSGLHRFHRPCLPLSAG